jgi:hypothetical protein
MSRRHPDHVRRLVLHLHGIWDPPVLELSIHHQTLEPEQPVHLALRWDDSLLAEEAADG